MTKEKHDGKVISFINMKGGVGKTTLCREIGYTLNKDYNRSILFVDIDPQANLTQSLYEKFGVLSQNLYNNLPDSARTQSITINDATISKLFNNGRYLPEKEDIIVDLQTKTEHQATMSLIPGDLQTVFLERTNSTSNENSLDKFIVRRDIRELYDYVFIDCPPTYSFYTTTAFNACDYYIVPVGIDPYSVLGISLLEQVVDQIKENDFRRFDGKTLQNMGIIFTPNAYLSSQTISRQFENQKRVIKNSKQLQKYSLYYFETPFLFNSKYRESLDYFTMDNIDKQHNDNVSAITEEFISRLTFLDNEKRKKGANNE